MRLFFWRGSDDESITSNVSSISDQNVCDTKFVFIPIMRRDRILILTIRITQCCRSFLSLIIVQCNRLQVQRMMRFFYLRGWMKTNEIRMFCPSGYQCVRENLAMYNSFSINWNRLYDIWKSLVKFNIDHEIQDIDDMYDYSHVSKIE